MQDHCATKEELNLQIKLGEERMDAKLEKYAMDNNKVISNLFGDVNETLKGLDEKLDGIDFEALSKMTDFFKGVVGFRSFIVGLASVVLAISAIGAGVIFIIKSVKY